MTSLRSALYLLSRGETWGRAACFIEYQGALPVEAVRAQVPSLEREGQGG
jgi:hypothetical protein